MMLFPHMCPNPLGQPPSFPFTELFIFLKVYKENSSLPQGLDAGSEQIHVPPYPTARMTNFILRIQSCHSRKLQSGNSCHCLHLFINILSLMMKAEVVKSNSCTLPSRPTDIAFITIKCLIGGTIERGCPQPSIHSEWVSGCGIWQIRWPELKLGHHSSKE